MGIVRASISNWFLDSLQTKSRIEASFGMYVYLMNI